MDNEIEYNYYEFKTLHFITQEIQTAVLRQRPGDNDIDIFIPEESTANNFVWRDCSTKGYLDLWILDKDLLDCQELYVIDNDQISDYIKLSLLK